MQTKIRDVPIEFIKGEDYCRWKGALMNDQTCKKLFKIEYGEIIEGENYILIGSTLFCSSFKGFIKDLQKIIKGSKPLIAQNLIYEVTNIAFTV